MSRQSETRLFEPIKMESIELETIDDAQPAQEPSIPEFSRFQTGILALLYLCVFVGNGQITIPLFLVIPLILVHTFQSSVEIVLPTLLGAAGLVPVVNRLKNESVSRKQSATNNLGLIFMLSSLFFYWTVSETPVLTFATAGVFTGFYFYWSSTTPKV